MKDIVKGRLHQPNTTKLKRYLVDIGKLGIDDNSLDKIFQGRNSGLSVEILNLCAQYIHRFSSEKNLSERSLDEWRREIVAPLGNDLLRAPAVDSEKDENVATRSGIERDEPHPRQTVPLAKPSGDVARNFGVPRAMGDENFVDLLVMVALDDEQRAIIHPNDGVFGLQLWTEKESLEGDTYHEATLPEEYGFLRVAVGLAGGRQGSLSMVKKTTSLVTWMRPRCAVLVGVCAGNGGVAQYGDVVLPHLVLDEIGGGKRTSDSFKSDGFHREGQRFGTSDQMRKFSETWKDRFLRSQQRPDDLDGYVHELLSRVHQYQTANGAHPTLQKSAFNIPSGTTQQLLGIFYARKYLQRGHNGLYELTKSGLDWFLSLDRPSAKPRDMECVFNRHLATVRDVEENDEVFTRLEQTHGRNVAAVEREAIGFLEAVVNRVDNYFVAKAVQDYARFPKTDHYRMFAARASAAFAIEYVVANVHLLKKRSSTATAPKMAVGPLISGPSWSQEWAFKQVTPWNLALTKVRERLIYIYGARKAGKSILVMTLCEQLDRSKLAPRFIYLNLKEFVDQFMYGSSASLLQQQILSSVARQFDLKGGWRQTADTTFDFSTELSLLFKNDPSHPVYLVVEEADSPLRVSDPDVRRGAIGATSPLFHWLKRVVDASSDPISRRIQAIVTGSTPAEELAKAYQRSPFNAVRSFILRRFTKKECDQFAIAVGLTALTDHERLFVETGGHCSLVWAVLRHIATLDDQQVVLPRVLDDLPVVRSTFNVLEADLNRQPDLQAAFGRMLSQESINQGLAERLRDAMFAVGDNLDELRCQCPMMERRLVPNRLIVGASR